MDVHAKQNELYTDAVRDSHRLMTEYETFRKKYPDEIYPEERCLSDTCTWRKYGKDPMHKFTEKDLQSTQTIRCQYSIEKRMRFNHHRIETRLYGSQLAEIKEINKFVVTHHGIGHSYKKIKIGWTQEKSPMFIRFSVPLISAIKICQAINKFDYSYAIIDIGPRKVIKIKDDTLCKYTFVFKISVLEQKDNIRRWYDGFRELFVGDNRLVEVVIEDINLKKKDLYQNVLGILKVVCVDQTRKEDIDLKKKNLYPNVLGIFKKVRVNKTTKRVRWA